VIEAIKQAALKGFPLWQEIRRYLHSHPELSFEETQTAAYVSTWLSEWCIPQQQGVAGTGIVALLEGKNPGKRCIAIRSELDALPITEQNKVPYKSLNEGVMHACGHDVHTTCLLATAKVLQDLRQEWEGTIKLIFQPGEEKHPGGGSLMLAEGVLENPRVDAVLALHVYPHLPSGMVGFREGQYMASADEVYITVKGKGGHAALPHTTIDPVTAAAQVLVALQQVVSRKAPAAVPSVLSFGKIAGGHVGNVIPDEVVLEGTFRTMDETWRAQAHTLIAQIATQTAAAFGATAMVHIPKGYPSLINNPALTRQARAWAGEFLGQEKIQTLDLRMTADDFAYYSQAVPGCYFRLGTNKNGEQFTASVHNAHFDIDETAMLTGIGAMSWIAVNALKGF